MAQHKHSKSISYYDCCVFNTFFLQQKGEYFHSLCYVLKRLLLLPLWPLAKPGSYFKLSDEKEESNLSTPCYKSSSLTRVQIIMLVIAMWCLYPTTELLKKNKKKRKNRSSCHIWEAILCEPSSEVFYRPHLILTATHRQVPGSPTSGWRVPAVACPESCGEQGRNTLTVQSSSS